MGDSLSFFILISIILLVVISAAISNLFKRLANKVKERPIYKAISIILTLSLGTAPLAIEVYNDRYTKIPFDKLESKTMLEETWKPLKDFKDNITIDKNNNTLLPPKYIKTKDDFMNAFASFPKHLTEGLYDALIIETDSGTVLVNPSVHIPSIFDEGSHIGDCYIKRKKHIEELIIEEGGWIESIAMGYTRKNTYIKNKNGDWIYTGFTGSS